MDSRLVLFDTNVIEGRYLGPLLAGEKCEDFERLQEKGYQPAVFVKTLYEIWNHAKLDQL